MFFFLKKTTLVSQYISWSKLRVSSYWHGLIEDVVY